MTAQATLRAALEKPSLHAAILEAMQQHRAEALEEVYKWVSDNRNHAGITAYDYRLLLKAKIVALKGTG